MEQLFGQIIISAFIAAALWGGLNGWHHAADAWRERYGKHVSKNRASFGLMAALILLCGVVICFVVMHDPGYALVVPLTVGIYYLRRCIRLLEGDHPAA